MWISELTLSPAVALAVFVVAVIAGHRYRRVWKTEGSRTAAWFWGLLAAAGLIIAALIPLQY